MKNPIRTLIVDDEIHNRRMLRQLIDKYCPHLTIIAEAANASEAHSHIVAYQPDLVFLDISMPQKNAFEMLEDLSEINFLIVFVTAHNEYAIKAFQYSAINYLLKPIEESLFIKTVQQIEGVINNQTLFKTYQTLLHHLDKSNHSQELKICLPTQQGFDIVQTSEIVRCQAKSNYTFIYLKDNTQLCVSKTLSEIEEMLPTHHFSRIHQSHLINLNCIRKYLKAKGGFVMMTDGTEIEISRRKKSQFLDYLKTSNLSFD